MLECYTEFETEDLAHQYVMRRFNPFCASLHHERPLRKSGNRPDFTFSLKVLPDRHFVLESKPFRKGGGATSDLCSAIAQANSYALETGRPAFVGPLFARGVNSLYAIDTEVRGALLTGAHFNVGCLSFVSEDDRFAGACVGHLSIGGVAVATFTFDEHGQPATSLHRDYERLLVFKSREGSSSWRRLGT